MKVLCDEGVAIHIGPEPCASVREGRGEASVGVCVGQPSSGDSYTIRSVEGVPDPEDNIDSLVNARGCLAPRRQRPRAIQFSREAKTWWPNLSWHSPRCAAGPERNSPGQRPWHAHKSPAREPGDLRACLGRRSQDRTGKAGGRSR